MTSRPKNLYSAYHAHVYFDEQTADHVAELCRKAGERFEAEVGRFHRRKVGPHPHWSCQLPFQREEFAGLINWLDQNRDGLSVLIHGLTGNDLVDHTEHASWPGSPIPLNLKIFHE